MTSFASDVEFKKALSALDAVDQRVVSATFVQHVADLSDDERVRIVLDVAKSREATSEELSGALKIAKSNPSKLSGVASTMVQEWLPKRCTLPAESADASRRNSLIGKSRSCNKRMIS